jgi:hypothetical protein
MLPAQGRHQALAENAGYRIRVVRIVDFPDGSIVLPPDPKRVRQQRLLFGVAWFLVVGSGVAFVETVPGA